MEEFLYFLLGAVGSWATSHFYYKRSLRDMTADGDSLRRELTKTSRPGYFNELVAADQWVKQYIDDQETWSASKINGYQIVIGNETRSFDEPWTRVFPDKTAFRYEVSLRVGGNTTRQFSFVSVDGGRIRVPMPKQVT